MTRPSADEPREYLDWLPEGEVVERKSAGGFESHLVHTRSTQACDDPATPFLAVQMLTRGTATIEANLGHGEFQGPIQPGEFIVVPPDTPASVAGVGDFEALCIAVPSEAVSRALDRPVESVVDRARPLFQSIQANRQVARLLEILWSETGAGNPYGDVFADGLLTALLAQLTGKAGEMAAPPRGRLTTDKMEAVREWIHDHLSGRIHITDLANLVGLSPSHFIRVFKRSTGVTPTQFVLGARLERARDLLRSTRLPLAEISRQVGFFDQSHLTRHYRKRFGESPSAARRSSA